MNGTRFVPKAHGLGPPRLTIGVQLAPTHRKAASPSTRWPNRCAIALYECDRAGNEIAQIDALRRTNTYTYDGLGRRIGHTLPGGQTESFGYDLTGNQIRVTNCNRVIITNQFDSMNRLTSRTSTNGYSATFAYSPTGQRTNMTDATGTTGYAYDSRDRLSSRRTPDRPAKCADMCGHVRKSADKMGFQSVLAQPRRLVTLDIDELMGTRIEGPPKVPR